jgi:hypothetical protein
MHQPKPWFRASKSAWYVQHQGQQVRLGEHPEATHPSKKSKAGWNAPPPILDAFYKLMASDPADLSEPDVILTAQVLDLFLSHSEWHNGRATYLWYKPSCRASARSTAVCPPPSRQYDHLSQKVQHMRDTTRKATGR